MRFAPEKFVKVFYLEHGGKGQADGRSADHAAALVDGDLWAIPANVVIEKVYAIVDSAITGTTNFDVGDDDDADGFIDGSITGSVNGGLGTPGMYGYSAKIAGAYLRTETAGVTDPADVYVVPNAKAYLATGKELKLDVTGSSLGGKARVIVEGLYFGANQAGLA